MQLVHLKVMVITADVNVVDLIDQSCIYVLLCADPWLKIHSFLEG